MGELRTKIRDTIAQIDTVVEMFYQQKTQEAYLELDPVLSGMMELMEPVLAWEKEHPGAGLEPNGLTEALREALSAMEERDAILMADVLKYEVAEKLEAIAEKLA